MKMASKISLPGPGGLFSKADFWALVACGCVVLAIVAMVVGAVGGDNRNFILACIAFSVAYLSKQAESSILRSASKQTGS